MKVKCYSFCLIGKDNACNFLSACHSVIGQTSRGKLSAEAVLKKALIDGHHHLLIPPKRSVAS